MQTTMVLLMVSQQLTQVCACDCFMAKRRVSHNVQIGWLWQQERESRCANRLGTQGSGVSTLHRIPSLLQSYMVPGLLGWHSKQTTPTPTGLPNKLYGIITYAVDFLFSYVKRMKGLNPLPTNDAPMRHDLCELSISLWEFIWGV